MRRVVVESPYAGDIAANVAYARRALRDCLRRGEAPIASHLLFTQPGVLDDAVPVERQLGIDAGLAWAPLADATAIYTDRGMSRGMLAAVAHAEAINLSIEYRSIEPDHCMGTQCCPRPCRCACAPCASHLAVDSRSLELGPSPDVALTEQEAGRFAELLEKPPVPSERLRKLLAHGSLTGFGLIDLKPKRKR